MKRISINDSANIICLSINMKRDFKKSTKFYDILNGAIK